MLRLIFRFLGLMLLAAAFAALVVDGTRSIASNAIVLTSFGETLAQLAPVKSALWEGTVDKKVGPWAAAHLVTFVLALPNWLIAAALGGLLFLLTRRRRAPIGFSTR
ncbi:MAG: hypothetical protein KGM42_09870 [Hyphomicrobiales bacterium]|nr:hypothetical protein [Hyphomicrobiales bacterium]